MKYIFIFLTAFILLNCKKEANQDLTIYFYCNSTKYYVEDNNAIISFDSDQALDGVFNFPDIEDKIHFNINITDSDDSLIYNLNCRLWPKGENKVNAICKFDEDAESIIINIYNNKTIQSEAEYADYNLKIIIDIFELFIYSGYNVPFLYSPYKEITVDQETKKINLEFYYELYDDQYLFIKFDEFRELPLENCKKETKTINCEISREKLDIMANTTNEIKVFYILNEKEKEHLQQSLFYCVHPITIKYTGYIKEDIIFEIKNISENTIDVHSSLTFETNITNCNKIKTAPFEYRLTPYYSYQCFFIKHDENTPLYLTCFYNHYIGENTVINISSFIAEDIHYKYNFILADNFNETINNTMNAGFFIKQTFPEILDFTKGNNLFFYLNNDNDIYFKGLKLFPEGKDVNCKRTLGFIIYCQIDRKYFIGKKDGYYSIYQRNSLEKYVKSYETFGLNVILPKVSSSKVSKYSFGILAFICFLAF